MPEHTQDHEHEGSTADSETGGQVIHCGALLNIAGAATLHARLLDACRQGQALTLDFSDPDRIDTAGIQLLCSFINYSKQQAVPLRWRNVPEALTATAAQLGLGELLKISPE